MGNLLNNYNLQEIVLAHIVKLYLNNPCLLARMNWKIDLSG